MKKKTSKTSAKKKRTKKNPSTSTGKKNISQSSKTLSFSEDSVPIILENVLSRINPDKKSISIVDIDLEDSFYRIDGLAFRIWLSIDGKKSLKKIKMEMIKKFSPPPELFNQDFLQLIKKLRKEKLITL